MVSPLEGEQLSTSEKSRNVSRFMLTEPRNTSSYHQICFQLQLEILKGNFFQLYLALLLAITRTISRSDNAFITVHFTNLPTCLLLQIRLFLFTFITILIFLYCIIVIPPCLYVNLFKVTLKAQSKEIFKLQIFYHSDLPRG